MENDNNINCSEDILLNQYNKFQKRLEEKSTYYNNSIKYLKEIKTEIDRHIGNLNIINSESKLKKSTILDEIFNLFLDSMKAFLDNHKKLINSIIKHLENYISDIKVESPLYNEFKQFLHNYKNQQKKFNQIKDKFHESARVVETKTLKLVQKKNEKKINQPIDLSKKLKKEVETNLKKYQTSIDEINKKMEEYNSRKSQLIHFLVEIENNESEMYQSILKEFWKYELERMLQYFYQEKLVKFREKSQNNDKDINKEQKETLNKLKNNEKKEKKKSFEYKSNIDFDNCLENGDFNIYAETMEIIKNNFNNIYDDITIEKEKIKNNVRELIKKFFEFDEQKRISEIKEEEINLYFNSLKDPYTHNTFIKLLTKLRTNTKFNREKKLIDILGKSFLIIMEEAEKSRNFWTAKNCLILSQTFFYEEKQDDNSFKKIYPFELFKIKSWLLNKDFWIEYTFWMIEEEFKKFSELFDDITFEDLKNNKQFSPKINNRISDILFSQLLPSITNMLEFTHNKIDAIEIIELFHEKYTYLTEDKMKNLYQIISNDEEEIKKIKEKFKCNKKGNIIDEISNNQLNKKNINNEADNNKISENEIINNEKENKSIINNYKEENNKITEENKNTTSDKIEDKYLTSNVEKENNNIINDMNQDKKEKNKNNQENKDNKKEQDSFFNDFEFIFDNKTKSDKEIKKS